MSKKRIPEVDIPCDWIRHRATSYIIEGKHRSDEIAILFELISDWKEEVKNNEVNCSNT